MESIIIYKHKSSYYKFPLKDSFSKCHFGEGVYLSYSQISSKKKKCCESSVMSPVRVIDPETSQEG